MNIFSLKKMIFTTITEDMQKLPFYVTGAGSLKDQHPCVRPNGMQDYQFLYTTAGSGHLKVNNQEYSISENMGFFLAPGEQHEYYATESPWTTWWILFDGYATAEFPAIKELVKTNVFYIQEMDKLQLFYNNIYTAADCSNLLGANDASYHLYNFLLHMNDCLSIHTQKKRQSKHIQLKNVLFYIESHFHEDITLSQLSNIICVTPQHLCRLFKRDFNMRPMEYLNKCRLQNAKEFLVSANPITLKEIAARCGFHDVSYFCSIFKRYEGMTPIEFKNLH